MKWPFFNKEKKANPPSVLFADESTRGALNKVLLPNFLFKPPFGTPRYKDVFTLRRLGRTTYAQIAKQTIIDEVVSVPWSIKPREEEDELTPVQEAQIDEMENFFNNPNTNDQSFEYLLRQMLNDLLDFDSGIWVKEFDASGRMVEIIAADGASFLKNPDIHGRFTHRDDIIIDEINLVTDPGTGNFRELNQSVSAETGMPTRFNSAMGMTIEQAAVRAAYFQFGFMTVSKPIPFGRKEVVWFEKNPVTDQIYGKSPMESILDVIQTLVYAIEYNLDYFEDNNVPKGFFNLPGMDTDGLEAFRQRWNEQQLKTNSTGQIKKNFHRVPMTNSENASFVRVQFSASELQLIEMQKWFSKLVWSTFEITPSELGFTDDSNKATEVGQSKVTKRKGIIPILRMIEENANSQLLSEWDFGGSYKFEFNTFDIDDEKNKMELFKIQKDMGFHSVNELRKKEGLEEVEGGNHGDEKEESMAQEFNGDKEDPQKKFEKEKNEQKTLTTASPVAPKEFELIDRTRKLLRKKEKELLEELRRQAKGDRLTQIKSFLKEDDTINTKAIDDVLDRINNFINFDVLKGLINQITSAIFKTEADKISLMINNKPIQSNQEQIKFLADTTFQNIKGMEDDLSNKLQQQIRISLINGEGIGKMAERVKSVFDVSENRASMIARTELNRIENMGALEASKKAGVPMMKWILIVKDKRTSEISKAMDRKYGSREKAIPVNEDFTVQVSGKTISGPAPPFHVNERDTLITFVGDEKPANMKARLKAAMK